MNFKSTSTTSVPNWLRSKKMLITSSADSSWVKTHSCMGWNRKRSISIFRRWTTTSILSRTKDSLKTACLNCSERTRMASRFPGMKMQKNPGTWTRPTSRRMLETSRHTSMKWRKSTPNSSTILKLMIYLNTKQIVSTNNSTELKRLTKTSGISWGWSLSANN